MVFSKPGGTTQFNPWPYAMIGILLMTALLCVVVFSIARDNPSPFIDTASWAHGQQFERELTLERALAKQGAQYLVEASREFVQLTLSDSTGKPIEHVPVSVGIAYAASDAFDQSLSLKEIAPGIYRAVLSGRTGTWFLKISGTLNNEPFEIRETRTIN